MCNDFKAGGGKRFMDELAATANMDLAALAKWAKRPSPQKDSSKNDPLGGCLIVNRLAVHLQNTGRATGHSSPNSRCSEAQRIEDERYLHPMRRSEMAAELRRAPCADDSKRTSETWIARVIVHSIEPTKLPNRARLRLRHSKQ